MFRIYLIIYVFILSISAKAQFKSIEFEISATYSLIRDLEIEPIQTNPNLVSTTGYVSMYSNSGIFKENYSGGLGFCAESKALFSISKRFDIIVGIGFQYSEFKREKLILPSNSNQISTSVEYLNPDDSTIIGSYGTLVQFSPDNLVDFPKNNPSANLLYLEIPFSFSYHVTQKLIVESGVNMSQRIYSQTKGNVYSYDITNGIQIIEQTYTDGRGFNSTQIFLTAGLGYNVWKNIYCNISYKRSLIPIFNSEEQFAGKSYYNLLGLGLSYRLQRKND